MLIAVGLSVVSMHAVQPLVPQRHYLMPYRQVWVSISSESRGRTNSCRQLSDKTG